MFGRNVVNGRRVAILRLLTLIFFISVGIGLAGSASAASDDIYIDSLAEEWRDRSWGTMIDLAHTSTVHGGSSGVAVTYSEPWGSFYVRRSSPLDGSLYESVRFWLHGGSSGADVQVALADGSDNILSSAVQASAPAGSWTLVEIPLAELGSPATIGGIAWQEGTGSPRPTIYLDDIALVSGPERTAAGTIALTVDLAAEQGTINPDIYGINFGEPAQLAAMNIPLRRWGGNATSRYNWQLGVSNRASDWYFENIPDPDTNAGTMPNGSHADLTIEENRAHGTETIMTVPTIGWVAKSREISCGFSVAKYGAQQATDPWRSDCGNGVLANGTKITWNDPLDTSMAIGPDFVKDWMRHLTGKYGTAANGGVRYYSLDNEPMLWHETHRDVHPEPAGYDEVRDRAFAYAPAIKAVDPTAQVLGPAVWGWTAYFYSAIDSASGNWSNPPDQAAHGGIPFVPWYLQQMAAYERQHGTRILDYLDLHYYPQGAGVSLAPAGGAATQALRLRSTRALWDPTYVDESWINQPVMLIPRMQQWVDANYPGTKLALTEYNFGGLESINGALAQADALGIFGREGLDMATLWAPPAATAPGAFAFRMYRNYDGQNSTFGERSLLATSSDQGKVAVYAARRSADGAVTIMVINKSGSAQTASVGLTGLLKDTTAAVYRYSGANLSQIVRLADRAVPASGFQESVPANSITLYELAPSTLQVQTEVQNHHVYLSFVTVAGASKYQVHRSHDPYLDPTTSEVLAAPTTATEIVDTDGYAAGLPVFYQVVARDERDNLVQQSSRIGVFGYDLAGGT